MPRKTRLLPYLRETKSGRLEYVRRVPPELQKYLGERRYLTQVLPVEGTNVRNKAVIRAWTTVNGDIEAQLAAAKAQLEAEQPAELQTTPLAPRDVAVIAAEPWRQLRNAAVTGQTANELEEKVVQTVLITLNALLDPAKQGSAEAKAVARAEISDVWLTSLLKQLSIEPSEALMQQIRQRYQGYLGMAQADAARLKEGDFQTSDLESKAPPLPSPKVSFETLVDEWLAEAGGIREIDGVGVSQERIEVYRRAIAELIETTQLHYPAEIEIEQARLYLRHLQGRDCEITTKQRYLSVIKNLYSLGVRLGYLDANVELKSKLLN